jgi:predicted TIM-barrel fold metal-dependent hydrolase
MRVIAIEEHYSSGRFADAVGTVGGRPQPPELAARLNDLGEARVADMDAAGIDLQVVSLTAPGLQQLDPGAAVPLAREENDRLAEAAARFPDRLAAFAALPTADPSAAVGELERTVGGLGFKGGVVNGHTRGRFLDDRSFWPILECAEALGTPIYLHPTPPPQPVLDAYYTGFSPAVSSILATSAWGWHVETGLHLLRLVLAGVFDRYPGLQLIVGHMGEALPFMLARASRQLAPAVTGLRRSVSDYVRDNVSITTSGFFATPPFLTALLELGADRILFSVDYPYSSNREGRAFLDRMPVSPADREKIAHGNAERLLRV